MTRHVRRGGAWVTVDSGGGSATDYYPDAPLTDGYASNARNAVVATASASTNTWGAWVEITPSLSADSDGVSIYISSSLFGSATNHSDLIQIGTGASASETAWATFAVGYRAPPMYLMVPGRLTAGTRVAVRVQSSVSSVAISAVYTFLGAKTPGLGAPVSHGFDTATSQGVTLDAPAGADEGAWTEIVASTAAEISALMVTIQGAGVTTMANASLVVDIGLGASGSESPILENLAFFSNSFEYISTLGPSTWGVSIPAGSRISARYVRNSASNAADLCIVGAGPA